MKIIIIFVLSLAQVLAQHGFSTEWSNAVILPRYNEALNAKQRGVLYNNMVITNGGRIVVSTSEHNPSNMNQVYGYYLTYSDDGGQTWLNPPIRFTPIDQVIGGSALKLAIDNEDNIYAIWNSMNPAAIFISRLDTNLVIITDSVRIASKVNYNITSTNLTVDRYNRLHVMWNEGSTNSSNTAEVYYSRSTDFGNNWQTPQMLSSNDGKHSAFPHAQFDTAGDTLAIAWRDSVGGVNKWDVYISISTNGGISWSPSPIAVLNSSDTEWDPDLIIDPFNRIHLFYTVYPATNPFDGARNYYRYSDDAGVTWNLPVSPSNGMISDIYRSQLLEGTRYDVQRNILFTTWKDERDFDFGTGAVRGDIMINFSSDRGITWSTPEFVTDLADSTVAFKAGGLLPSGEYCINYEVMYPEDINLSTTYLRVFFKKRNPVITSVLTEKVELNGFSLEQNYPNPFNPSTKIRYSIPNGVRNLVTIKVYGILGNEVATLVNEEKPAGIYEVEFNASQIPSGIYFYKLQTSGSVQGFLETKKMIVLK